jgi:hypothetical protein
MGSPQGPSGLLPARPQPHSPRRTPGPQASVGTARQCRSAPPADLRAQSRWAGEGCEVLKGPAPHSEASSTPPPGEPQSVPQDLGAHWLCLSQAQPSPFQDPRPSFGPHSGIQREKLIQRPPQVQGALTAISGSSSLSTPPQHPLSPAHQAFCKNWTLRPGPREHGSRVP